MISIVIPVYNRVEHLYHLSDQIKHVMACYDYEVIFVDDASPVDSESILLDICKNQQFKCLFLRENVGQQNATLAGLRRAKGDIVVTIDNDYNEELFYLPDMIQMIDNYEVIYGVHRRSEQTKVRYYGTFFKEWLFYVLFQKPNHLVLTSYKVMTKSVVTQIIKDPRPYVYLSASILKCTCNIGNYELPLTNDKSRSNYKWYQLMMVLFRLVLSYKLGIYSRKKVQYNIKD